MKAGAHQFSRISDAFYDGRTELGFSIENDAGGFDAFVGDKFLGPFPNRTEARSHHRCIRGDAAMTYPTVGADNLAAPYQTNRAELQP